MSDVTLVFLINFFSFLAGALCGMAVMIVLLRD